MKNRLGLAGLALVMAAAGNARADRLPELSTDMAKLLSDMKIIAEQSQSDSLRLRLIRVQEDGECDGAPQTCPLQSVYIAVSEWGEYRDRKLYQLPDSHGWEFEDWLNLSAGEGPDDYLEFTMIKQVPAEDTSTAWWVKERYKVKVNLHDAILEPIQP